MGFHTQTGEELLPIDKNVVQAWRVQVETNKPIVDKAPPKRIENLLEVEAPFDPLTGKPKVWYWKNPTGSYEFFDNEGFHPGTGERLIPITREFFADWKSHVGTGKIPARITEDDVAKIIFFDPLTGEPRVWFWKSPSGSYELFDNEGYHPGTGDHLQPVTKEVVGELKQPPNPPPEPICYVITREGVSYGYKAGIDPVTGKECREIKPGLLERLREYEKGKRPTRITEDVKKITFFDPRTGEPIVWYFKRPDGTIELFDLMGFHPETGEELLPVDKDVVGGVTPPPPIRIENPQESDFF